MPSARRCRRVRRRSPAALGGDVAQFDRPQPAYRADDVRLGDGAFRASAQSLGCRDRHRGVRSQSGSGLWRRRHFLPDASSAPLRMPLRQDATTPRSTWGNVPSRSASRASTVAIFAGHTIDGAGSPAERRSEMPRSPRQPRFSALVIMTSYNRPCALSISPAATTSAGRRCRTGRSVVGNGTLTTSHTSKIAISPPIGLGRPLMESGEWIVDRFLLCLGQITWLSSIR